MSDFYDQEKDTGSSEKYDDFYLRLRGTVDSYVSSHTSSGVAKLLLYVPDFFYLLVKLAADENVPRGNKVQIAAALAYFLSPLDVIPDVIPGLGLLDDLYIALIVTDSLLNSVDIELVKRYWPGDEDIVYLTKYTLDALDEKLGARAISRILAKFRNNGGTSGEDE